MTSIIFDQSQIRYLSSGKYEAPGTPTHPRRKLQSTVLLVGCDGECPIAQDGREYILSEGTYMLLFPNCEHYGTAAVSPGQSHMWCHFVMTGGVSYSDGAANLQNGTNAVALPEYGALLHPEKFLTLFHSLTDAAERSYLDASSRERICGMYLGIILRELYENALEARPPHGTSNENAARGKAAAARLREYLRMHCSEDIELSSLADAFRYSTDYLTHVFGREYGMTPCAYLNTVRLDKAKRLLLDTDMRVSDISEAVGFHDAKYFMKAFKRCTGVTPSEFRGVCFRVHFNSE